MLGASSYSPVRESVDSSETGYILNLKLNEAATAAVCQGVSGFGRVLAGS